MADKSILSRLQSRPSFESSSVEITIIEPHVRCLQSHSKHQHHHHHHKRTEQKKWEVREDLQKKMKEVKQKIAELETQGCQESLCQSSSNSKKQHDYVKTSNVTGYPSGTLRVLTRSISEGALLQKRKKKFDCQKLYPSRKSIVCQTCNLRLSQQEELLRFVSAQHQQVLHMMHEIKAELQVIKNDKMLEHNKRKDELLTVFHTDGAALHNSHSTIEQTKYQQQQDTDLIECGKPISGVQQDVEFGASTSQTNKTVKTEKSATTSGELQEKQLPTVKEIVMLKDSVKKENMECVDRTADSSQKNPMKQNGDLSNQYITDNGTNSIYSVEHTTEVLSEETHVKCSIPQPSVSKDLKTLVDKRKLNSKSFFPEMTDKVKEFPHKGTLFPLNRLNTTKQANRSTIAQQKTLTSAWGPSKSYGHKDDPLQKDNPNRQIKSLKLLRACRLRQLQHRDKDVSSPVGTKEDWRITDNNRNIPTISHISKINNNEDNTHDCPGGLINEYDSSPTSQTCFKPPSDINAINQVDLGGEKEAHFKNQDSSTSTELENAEITSTDQNRKHKLGKLLKTKKSAFFGSSGASPLSKPPRLNRESPLSLTFVIERSKSKTAETAAPENNISFQCNTTDATTAPKQAVCTSHYVHSASYTTPSLSFGGKCNMHMVDTAVVHGVEGLSTKRNLGRVLTKKSIKTSSEQSHSSSDKMPSPKDFCCMEQQKDDCTLPEVPPGNQTPVLKRLQYVPHHTLVFWNGKNLIVGEEARCQMNALMSSCLHQDKKENLRKMFDVQDNVNLEERTAAANKGPVWEHNAPESKMPQNVLGNYMQQSYMNPNFNFIPTSEASITPRYADLGLQDKQDSNPSTRFEPVGSEDDMQEIELSLSFDDLEYLLLHKIRKQELKHDVAQVETLRRTLNAVRQCFKAQQEFLKGSSEALKAPKQTLSRIRTVILSPRNFVSGQHVRNCKV